MLQNYRDTERFVKYIKSKKKKNIISEVRVISYENK